MESIDFEGDDTTPNLYIYQLTTTTRCYHLVMTERHLGVVMTITSESEQKRAVPSGEFFLSNYICMMLIHPLVTTNDDELATTTIPSL